LTQVGDLAGAREAALSILGVDASNAETLQCLAEISRRADQPNHAVVWARRAAEAEPHKVERHHFLALALIRQGDLNSAEAAAHRALAIEPKHVGAMRAMVDVGLRRRDIASAATWAWRLVELEPNNEVAREQLDHLQRRLGALDAAAIRG
jgi:tetratricopeptide (TPR) repeat protein